MNDIYAKLYACPISGAIQTRRHWLEEYDFAKKDRNLSASYPETWEEFVSGLVEVELSERDTALFWEYRQSNYSWIWFHDCLDEVVQV